MATTKKAKKTAARRMFLDTFRIQAGKDLIHIGLMDTGPDGARPEKDGETLSITVPLSQLEALLPDLEKAFASRAYARRCSLCSNCKARS